MDEDLKQTRHEKIYEANSREEVEERVYNEEFPWQITYIGEKS